VLSINIALLDRAGEDQSATRQILSVFWWLFAAVDVIYKAYWDVAYDWGLGSVDNHYLRPRVDNEALSESSSSSASESSVRYRGLEASHLFPTALYYSAMVTTFVLRASGPLLGSSNLFGDPARSSVGACLEVFRRGLWNCLALENCHVAHCHEQSVRQTQSLEHFQRSVSKASRSAQSAPTGCFELAFSCCGGVGSTTRVAPSEEALQGNEGHGSPNTAHSFNSSSDGLELGDMKQTNGGTALDEATSSGVKSGTTGSDGSAQRLRGGTEVWLDESSSGKEGTAARRNSTETTKILPAAPFLTDEWLQRKLIEIQR